MEGSKEKNQERKNNYNKQKKEKIQQGQDNNFHQCVKAFNNNDKSKDWSPRELYPDLNESQAAEKLAQYFNNISNEYELLDFNEIPVTYDVTIPSLTCELVGKEIVEGKKTKSIVKGDIYCDILAKCIDVLVHPICSIF